MKPLLIPGPV